jgi:tripartite-type tricarboxylate transporter receptor subunit TctC
LRPLAVTTKARSPQLPGVPTVAESGLPDYEVISWFGVLAPGGMQKPVADRLSSELAKAMQTQDVREKLTQMGFIVVGSTSDEFGAHLKAEVAKWKRVVEQSGAKAD